MIITTNRYNVGKQEYFKLFLKLHTRRNWWFYLFMFVVLIIALLLGDAEKFYVMLLVFFAYPLIVLISIWKFIYVNQSKLLFAPRYHEFSEDKFHTSVEDSTNSEFYYKHLNKIRLRRSYTLLVISKTSQVYIPNRAFKNSHDLEQFRSLMQHVNTHVLGNFKDASGAIIDQ